MKRLLASVASFTRKARGGTKKRLILLLAVATGAAGAFAGPVPVHAATTTNVAYIFDFGAGSNDLSGPGSGSSIFVNAVDGTPPLGSYTTADLSKTVTITDVPVASIDAAGVAAITAFSTAILYEVCDIGSHPNTMKALNDYLNEPNHKLLIYDGDRCFGGFTPNYSTFLFPFTTSNPGPRGAESCYTTVLASSLTTGLAGYCDSGEIGGNDALGDANTFVTFNGAWCSSMTTRNVLGHEGLVQAYARSSSDSLVVYSGEDNWFTFGPRHHQRLVFDNEIKQDFNPDGLPCALRASGIALTPVSQTQTVPGSATLTATVTDVAGNPQSGIKVTFQITSGPNMAAHNGTDMGITNTSGQTSVTYSSVVTGTDTWIASFVDSLGNTHTSNAATVKWITPPEQNITATGNSFSATEGQPFAAQTVASFCDPNLTDLADYSATIAWGDGSSSPPPPVTVTQTGVSTCGRTFDVKGDHTYAEEGSYTLTVTIVDNDTPSNTATVNPIATVGDAALHAACAADPVSTQSFSGMTATFQDDNTGATSADFTATINWGDGTSSPPPPVTISGGPGPGPYTVSGTHTYASTGAFTITTTIMDDGGATATATCAVLIGAFPTANGGTFVVGDLEATGPRAALTWWSSQWATINQMSGGPAPASMKGFSGFEDNPLPSPLPSLKALCGMTWTTDTGNSTPPPQSVPDDMFVIVSSHITQNGSVISGDIKELILVHNNPGYAPDPGHPGTGTELILVC